MTKQQLRQRYITLRQQLTDAEYSALNTRLLEQFQQLDLSAVNCIHLFLPITERHEPDTELIRDWLKNTHPHIRIVLPKTNFRTLGMLSYADDADLTLAVSRYGITEPVAGNMVDAIAIDMVILPMLVFDEYGYRVGYGKGFYDRFVKQCRPDAKLIGLSLFDPIKSIDDVNEYDLWMHGCITPEKVWWWR